MQSQESRSCPQTDLGSAELLILVISIAKLRGLQGIEEETDAKAGRKEHTGGQLPWSLWLREVKAGI